MGGVDLFLLKRSKADVLKMSAPWKQIDLPHLETQPWGLLRAGDQQCLVKGEFDEEGYEIMVWDSTQLWVERVEQCELAKRLKARELN